MRADRIVSDEGKRDEGRLQLVERLIAGTGPTYDAMVHWAADLPRLTRNSRAMLRPGGLLMMHDFTLPPKRLLVALWRLYFILMRNTVARVFPGWKAIYDSLPRLIEQSRWLAELQHALARNDFADVKVDYQTLYGSAIVTAIKR